MELRSKTGRKIRKDSFESKHDMDVVIKNIKTLYLDYSLSTNEMPEKMESLYGIKITSLKCYYLIKDLGILRTKSESISMSKATLNYNESFLTKEMTSILDGILIGDGSISCNHNTQVARVSISCKYNEFTKYCYNMLKPYCPNNPKFVESSERKKSAGVWTTSTKYHPDLYSLYKRWNSGKKEIPKDMVLTPTLVLLWYLEDGSISSSDTSNSLSLYFSTNCFSRESIELVSSKFNEIGIETSRITSDNRLFIKSSSIPALLKYMGGKSPVECYSYKFEIDEWRIKKGMKEVSNLLGLDYHRLANWVKKGIVNYSRSPGGKKVVFSDNDIGAIKQRIECRELSREKGKRISRLTKKDPIYELTKKTLETDEDYLERLASILIYNGFPYKEYSDDRKVIKWNRLKNSQYVFPQENEIAWRKYGLPLADSFHPHIYELNRKNKISPLNLFSNKEMLMSCLKRNNAANRTITPSRLLSFICSDARSLRLNNFSPSLSRDIFNYYCDDGYKIIDPCSGFSGRLLGASVSKFNISYFGIEPSLRTYYGLIKTKEFLSTVNPKFFVNILNDCAENGLEQYRDEYFDFAFTSPPYFDTEEYDYEKNQSFVRFQRYDEWKDGFLRKVVFELYRTLKVGRFMVINIGKSDSNDIPEDLENISKTIGFELVEKKHIIFENYNFVSKEKRLEPIFVFRKN